MAEKLFFIHNNGSDDPSINLALEEYVLRHLDMRHTYLLLYINRPSVIIGRNQNPLQEVNISYIEERNIPVLRRASGGGAVYHDHGNLNFSFITRCERSYLNNYRKFTAPVIAALEAMGVQAELNDKNDIAARGKKISGTAQFATGKGIVTHGTLLFDAGLAVLHRALEADGSDITKSRAVRSIPGSVANIKDFLSSPLSMDTLRAEIRDAAAEYYGGATDARLEKRRWDAVEALAREKYDSWQWNYGRSPRFSVRRSAHLDSCAIHIRIDVEQGRIEKIDIDGRFADHAAGRALRRSLVGALYRKDDIRQAVGDMEPERYGEMITREFLLDLIFEA